MTEEYTSCLNCGKDDNKTGIACPTRKTCHFPTYDNWEPVGSKKEDTGCPTCQHWSAVKIGKFCPDCAQALK